MSANEPILVSVNDACAMISCSRPTLYKFIRESRVRAVRSGGRTLIPLDSLKEYAAALPDMMPTQPS